MHVAIEGLLFQDLLNNLFVFLDQDFVLRLLYFHLELGDELGDEGVNLIPSHLLKDDFILGSLYIAELSLPRHCSFVLEAGEAFFSLRLDAVHQLLFLCSDFHVSVSL